MMHAIEELQNFFKPSLNVEEPLQCSPDRSEFLKITIETKCLVYLPLFFKMFKASPNDALGMLIELRNPNYEKSKKHICRVILFALSVYYPDVYESASVLSKNSMHFYHFHSTQPSICLKMRSI